MLYIVFCFAAGHQTTERNVSLTNAYGMLCKRKVNKCVQCVMRASIHTQIQSNFTPRQTILQMCMPRPE